MPLLIGDYIRIKKMFKEFEELCKKDNAEGKEMMAVHVCQALTARTNSGGDCFI